MILTKNIFCALFPYSHLRVTLVPYRISLNAGDISVQFCIYSHECIQSSGTTFAVKFSFDPYHLDVLSQRHRSQTLSFFPFLLIHSDVIVPLCLLGLHFFFTGKR